MNWYRARWINNPFVDTLLKRLFTLALALVVSVAGVLLVSALIGDSGATETSYGVRKRALRVGLIFAVWIAIEAVRLIIQPIRAAITGKFLDEFAAHKEERRRARAARSPQGQRIAPGSTSVYRGQDPAAAGVPLELRITNVVGFHLEAQRWPDPQAAPGTDEYFHAQAISELNRAARNPEAPKDVQRSVKTMDFHDKQGTWRQRY